LEFSTVGGSRGGTPPEVEADCRFWERHDDKNSERLKEKKNRMEMEAGKG